MILTYILKTFLGMEECWTEDIDSVTYTLWYSDSALLFQYYLINKHHSLDIGSDMGHCPVFHYKVISNHLPISACSGVLQFDMKIFVNVSRLEIGQLFTQGMRRGHPCTLVTFLVYLKIGEKEKLRKE